MVTSKLFIQQLFSLANLGWAKGLFVNPHKNKQDIKDVYSNIPYVACMNLDSQKDIE